MFSGIKMFLDRLRSRVQRYKRYYYLFKAEYLRSQFTGEKDPSNTTLNRRRETRRKRKLNRRRVIAVDLKVQIGSTLYQVPQNNALKFSHFGDPLQYSIWQALPDVR